MSNNPLFVTTFGSLLPDQFSPEKLFFARTTNFRYLEDGDPESKWLDPELEKLVERFDSVLPLEIAGPECECFRFGQLCLALKSNEPDLTLTDTVFSAFQVVIFCKQAAMPTLLESLIVGTYTKVEQIVLPGMYRESQEIGFNAKAALLASTDPADAKKALEWLAHTDPRKPNEHSVRAFYN